MSSPKPDVGGGAPANYEVAKLPPYSSLPEPLLHFAADRADARDPVAADRADARDPHPLRGLVSFGPYTRGALAA